MKTPKINLVAVILMLLCITNIVNAQNIIESNRPNNSADYYSSREIKESNLYKSTSLFVKIKDATIVREIGSKHTWYTWKKALQDEIIPGQVQGHRWSTLTTDDQTIIKVDSATWELFVKVTLLGDDGKKINISYHSFDVPIVMTESKKYGWMNTASCEAGGYFYRDGYRFDMTFYEQRQNFRFRRIIDPMLRPSY